MPAGIEGLVREGSVTLFALLYLIVEASALLLMRRPAMPVVVNAISGLFLILALHAALLGGGAAVISGCLALGGLAHIADVVIRLRR